MTVANAMVLVDQTAVPLTLPAIMRQFDVGSALVQWVLNGSLLTLAALLVLGGQLGDLLGRRRVFIAGTGAKMFECCLEGDLVIRDSEGPGETGARGGQSLEAHLFQGLRAARVPRVRHHETAGECR
jgi:hypothetical protein